jgi:hypothetical protein
MPFIKCHAPMLGRRFNTSHLGYSGIESGLVDAGPGGHFTLLAACRSEIKGSLLVYSCGKYISCVTGCTRRPTLGD